MVGIVYYNAWSTQPSEGREILSTLSTRLSSWACPSGQLAVLTVVFGKAHGGAFTVTESAAVAVIYSLVVMADSTGAGLEAGV